MSIKIWAALIIAAVILLTALVIGTFSRQVYGDDVREYFNRPFLNQASEYQQKSLSVSIIQRLLTWAVLGAGAFLAWKHFAINPRPPLLIAAGYIAAFLIIFYLINLPLDFYRGFILEHSFGLSSQAWTGWLADYMKSRGISLLLTVPALTGLYFIMSRFLDSWWWIAGLVFTLFMILGSYLFPILVDPLFYEFKSLEDPAMRSSIISMAEDAGIEVDDVLVADASRKTHKANAYFTGIGKTRRIVLFDTLLTRFSPDEALAVIAHEMAHWRFNHIGKGIALSAAAVFFAFYLLHMIFWETNLLGDFRTIALSLVFFSLFSFVILPLQNTVSRHFEIQADLEAIRLTGKPSTHISLKQNLAQVNLADVQPHPFVRTILYTHPTTMERIELALEETKRCPHNPLEQ